MRDWSRNRIRQVQYEEAKKQNMNVRSWEDIGDIWQKDGSRENQEKMFQVMHGVFERKGEWSFDNSWSRQLENEFMTEYNLVYDTPEPERKASRKRIPAGIEDIIKGERPQLNKLLNLKTKMKTSHGKTIVVIGRVGKSLAKPSGVVRKKGIFYTEFIRFHKKFMNNIITGENTAIINQDTIEKHTMTNDENTSKCSKGI